MAGGLFVGGGAIGVVGALRVAGFGRFVGGTAARKARRCVTSVKPTAGRCPKPARWRPCHQRGGAT